MNVAFLIGNGFDLNLGLKTTYIDFLKSHYLLPNDDDLPVVKDFKETIQKDLVNNLSLWSDAELALGRCTVNFTKTKDFIDCHRSFCVSLCDYLKNLPLPEIWAGNSEVIKNVLRDGLTKFYERLLPEEIEFIASKFRESKKVNYGFIDFNYTRTLSRFLDLLPCNDQCFYEDDLKNQYFVKKPYLKVHGDLDSCIILGVGTEGQIENKDFRSQKIIQQALLKNGMHSVLSNGTKKNVCSTLMASDIICIYGMSLGKTDIFWWNYIVDLLYKYRDRYVVVFIKSETLDTVYPGDIALEVNEYKQRLFRNKRNLQGVCEERVLICRNPIFDFSYAFGDENGLLWAEQESWTRIEGPKKKFIGMEY